MILRRIVGRLRRRALDIGYNSEYNPTDTYQAHMLQIMIRNDLKELRKNEPWRKIKFSLFGPLPCN